MSHRKLQLKSELVGAMFKSAIATQDNFIFKQRHESIAVVAAGLVGPARNELRVVVSVSFAWTVRLLVDLGEAVQADDYVGDVEGFDGLEDHVSRDHVTGEVRPVLIVASYVKFGDVAYFLGEGFEVSESTGPLPWRGRGGRRATEGSELAGVGVGV